MSRGPGVDRRDFLKTGAVAGTGLVLGFYLEGPPGSAEAAEPFVPNAWIRIGTDGVVTVIVARSEMGQGILTTLPMLVAEELEADWSTIRVEQALADSAFGRHQSTNASRSIRESWDVLRQAGASAREMLISAAAQTWGVDRRTCRARSNAVIHESTGKRLSYGALASRATLPVPKNPPLKDPASFRLIGTRIPRVDTPAKVNGTAVYGLDAKVPGMLYATVTRCPVFGGTVDRCDATRATAVPGVRRVIDLKDRVGVVAESTWAALEGKRALDTSWRYGGTQADLSSHEISRRFAAAADTEGIVGLREGDVTTALAGATRQLEAVYQLPFEAHACLEPLTCTAEVRGDRCEIWLPTQTPLSVQGLAARLTGLDRQSVVVHPLLLGGGFGRKQMDDYVADAVELSKAVSAPVKVTWTREEDLQHDYYRPASYHRLRGGLDATGRPVAWSHRMVGPSSSAQNWEEDVARGQPWPGVSAEQMRAAGAREAMEGATELPYGIPNLQIDYVMVNTPVPVGWWRSVYYSQNGFVNECFLDELAVAGGLDPYQLRRSLIGALGPARPRKDCERWGGDGMIADRSCSPDPARMGRVLDLVAEKAGWGTPPREGQARGIAAVPYLSCDTYVAQVAEVSVSTAGDVRVHRVVCAVDCGLAVNPGIVEAQMEGAIVYGLTAALRGGITIEQGRVKQSNFHDYPMLRMPEMPRIEVHIVPSTEAPGGAGEAGVPPVAPAVCNAVFAATGQRIRELPIEPARLRRRT